MTASSSHHWSVSCDLCSASKAFVAGTEGALDGWLVVDVGRPGSTYRNCHICPSCAEASPVLTKLAEGLPAPTPRKELLS